MSKRTSYEIKRKILWAVKEKGATYAQLERKINTGFRTIKSNCEELAHYSLLNIEKEQIHPQNGHTYHVVNITEKGLKALKTKPFI